MLNTEESQPTFSLDALLGIQPQDEERPDAEEQLPEPGAGSPSIELLSMLGLASEEPPANGQPAELAQEPATATGSAAGGIDLRALLGLEDGEEVGRREAAPAPAAPPEAGESVAPVAPLALDALTKPSVESRPSTNKPVESKPAEVPVRSRFADAPAFRGSARREDPVQVTEKPAPAATVEVAPAPAMAMTPAVRYLAGSLRPLALPERASAQENRAASEARVPKALPAKPAKPDAPATAAPLATPAAKPTRPESAKPSLAVATSAPAKPLASQPAPAKPPLAVAKPVSASKPPAAAKPMRHPADVPVRPVSGERKSRPATRGNGVWYLFSAILFAIALACTCYAVYASAQSAAEKPAALISSGVEDAAGDQRFRYSVQSPDGTMRAVEETARFDVDGLIAESAISLAADSDAEAAQMLDDARSQFGDAWVSGSVKNGAALFTVKHGGERLDREAYAALLRSSTIDCETVE